MEQPPTTYIGFWRQLWAGSLDFSLIMITFIVAIILLMVITDAVLAMAAAWFTSLFFLYYFLYRTLSLASKNKATPCMRAVNIQVTDAQGKKISFARACVREVLTYVSFALFGIGYLIIPFTKHKQGLHDILTNCFVSDSS